MCVHLGLMAHHRSRQIRALRQRIERMVPHGAPLIVAGDFNDWGEKLDAPMTEIGLRRALGEGGTARQRTFPSRVPVFSLDRIYTRGLACTSVMVPRGTAWARMSDHLPMVAELVLA